MDFLTPKDTKRRKLLYSIMHIIVLLLSIFLVLTISIDTFHNVAFWKQPKFMKFQFWICILFLLDFFIEFFLAEKKWRYLITHIFFFIVSIPYLAIFNYFEWKFSPQVTYLIQYIPLVRGGYAMAIVVGWFSYNRATGLFFTYLFTLVATVFFASQVFFLFERNVNILVVDYYSALWWACMDVTTVGSNIEAVTPIGRILSVGLAALGMMMFPIFTVYITNIIQQHNQIGSEGEGDFLNNPSNMSPEELKELEDTKKAEDAKTSTAQPAAASSTTPSSPTTVTTPSTPTTPATQPAVETASVKTAPTSNSASGGAIGTKYSDELESKLSLSEDIPE